MEMDYLTVLHVRLDVNFRDLHAKDFSLFRKRLIYILSLKRTPD